MKTKELVTIAILAALLYIVQVAFSFLPNIELVSLLVLVYTLVFDKMTLKIIAVFIILEGVQWGFGLWWWSYIYVWPILYFVVRWLKNFIRIDDSTSDQYCDPERVDFDNNQKFIDYVFDKARNL